MNKNPSKFKKWFLGLFGGVPKSDFEYMETWKDECLEQIQGLTEERIRLEFSLEKEQRENETLKKQIVHDPMMPVMIKTQNIKLKEIKKVSSIGLLSIEQTERYLRDAVLMEAAQCIKVELKPSDLNASATLLIAEVEDE